MVSKVATILFFLFYGVNFFYPFAPADLFMAIDALVIAVALAFSW